MAIAVLYRIVFTITKLHFTYLGTVNYCSSSKSKIPDGHLQTSHPYLTSDSQGPLHQKSYPQKNLQVALDRALKL